MTKNETILKKSIEVLKHPSFKEWDQKKQQETFESIRLKWRKTIEGIKEENENLYHNGTLEDWSECREKRDNDFSFENEIYSLLINWFEEVNWRNSEDVKALFYYTEVLSNGNYDLNAQVLLKYHQQIQALIKKLILKPDLVTLSSADAQTGSLGELVENLVHLYFYHTGHYWRTNEDPAQYDLVLKDMANLLPQVIKAFPKDLSNLFFSTLQYHQEPQEAYVDLVTFYMRNSIDCYFLASELFSIHNEPSDFFHKRSPNIIKIVLQENDFSEKEIDYLIDNMLLTQLQINSKENQIKDHEAHILKLKSWKGCSDSVTEHEKELADFIRNWDKIIQKQWTKAIRRIAVSKPTFKSIEVMVKAFPKHPKSSILKTLLAEATEFKNTPKLYDLNNKPKTLFKDLHFKLLVIEELMYKQKILLPIFELDKFLKEHTKREIETHNCEIIPEVKKYFKNVEIPPELLAKVTTLYQDSGLNGGSRFIAEMFPDWDPGAGDEVYKITRKTIEDLELLPNLTKIIGIESSEPNKKILKAFEAKGIILEEEK